MRLVIARRKRHELISCALEAFVMTQISVYRISHALLPPITHTCSEASHISQCISTLFHLQTITYVVFELVLSLTSLPSITVDSYFSSCCRKTGIYLRRKTLRIGAFMIFTCSCATHFSKGALSGCWKPLHIGCLGLIIRI